MKSLKIFIAVAILTAAILGLIKHKRNVQTPQERMLDSVIKIFKAFS